MTPKSRMAALRRGPAGPSWASVRMRALAIVSGMRSVRTIHARNLAWRVTPRSPVQLPLKLELNLLLFGAALVLDVDDGIGRYGDAHASDLNLEAPGLLDGICQPS